MDELGERATEFLAERLHVRDPLRIGLAGDDRADLAVGRPFGLRQGLHRVPQLVERLGVGRDEGELDQVASLGSAGSRSLNRLEPRLPIGREHATHASVADDHGDAQPERAAQHVEVEGQDEVRDQPRVAEAEPDRAQDDGPADEPRHHLQHALEPSVPIDLRVIDHDFTAGRPPAVPAPVSLVDRCQPGMVGVEPTANRVEVRP